MSDQAPRLPALPSRFRNLAEARLRFGDRVDRLGPFLWRSDELADAAVARLRPGREGDALIADALEGRPGVPAELAALVESAREVPAWVEWDRVERGGRFFRRTGLLGGIVLGARSLIMGYASPAGNKPLVLSGRLREAAAPRLHETSRFVRAVISQGGMRRGGEGWRITLRVRLMHAQVRRMILASSRWRPEEWGHPINQHDMVATSLLFSVVTIDALRCLGVDVSPQESDDFMHLWRWVSLVMGVEPTLIPSTEAEAFRLGTLIADTQGPPDEDSRLLTAALLEAGLANPDVAERARARKTMGLAHAICRHLLGDELADQLGVPRTRERFLLPPAIAAIRAVERARRRSRRLDEALLARGERYWDDVLRKGLVYATMDFSLPGRLAEAHKFQ
jgi:hypothetical protein